MARQKDFIEVLARGVCVKDGRLLYCHSKGAENTYLPGGHVEFEEGARDALRREIEEELGLKAVVGRFLGAVEHTFMQKGQRHCEINLVFEFDAAGLDPSRVPEPREHKIEFGWILLAELNATPLEPTPLRDRLPQWLTSGSDFAKWESTYSG